MSGPIEESDRVTTNLGISAIEVKEGRTTHIGELGILRVLPTKRRRTIGPWCFVDLMSPGDVEQPPPLEIGPHPHIGLATVTWLFDGLVLHSDSLGTQQPIRPGELNLMTAGHGIAHAEEGLETRTPEDTGGIMGVQMWLAQPSGTRDGDSGFQHLKDLPEVDVTGGRGRLLIGEYGPNRSAAVFEQPAIGLDLQLETGAIVVTEPSFEYGIVPIDRSFRVEDAIVEPGSVAVVPLGYEQLRFESLGPGRLMILGGLPLGEEVKMWWNFVARTEDEISEAWRAWQSHNTDRFGEVPSGLARIEAPRPPWLGN
ncbi:MAG TPA: pirin family protein [Acidimicrobiia bacterium]|nr:pirin family protein [Acidimicrobiia bacterium]